MKTKSKFTCQSCGYVSPKWLGKCPDCESWNTLTEEVIHKNARANSDGIVPKASHEPITLDKIKLDQIPRYQTRISEFDRVLGGGWVPGSMVLLGGDPGIGKSTLILQALDKLMSNNVSVLYVTGEESQEQIKLRADRLKVKANITLLAENSLDQVLKHVQKLKPQVLVVDSIQTVFLPDLESAPGSVSQVRECAGKLLYFAKNTGTSILLIGHVTKEGSLAGPRILEHMVDCVCYFEGETTGQFRILRTIKNRYGSTNEIGIFEMTAEGLKEVLNPSEYFLKDKSAQSTGSCITCALEGTRPLLTEVQSLVSSSQLANPRRTAIGIDPNRLALIIAVLEKTTGLNLYSQDVYVNAVGGLKLYEPASDLAILLSLVSSFKNTALSGQIIAFGEVSLNGEIRAVSHIDKRIQEAVKLGYRQIVLPKRSKISVKTKDIEILTVSHVNEVIDLVFR
jgi:DNA repair protein RadA/Sms